uniref:ABC transporter substrate-binding protein n=1 Tax=Fundidesulfovibrio putealis TaxID=270496 RepID=A0A7C3WIS9_9BACT
MKKHLAVLAALALAASIAVNANAKTLKMALDADPPRLDYMSQLSGNLLAYAHWVFDPLVRWTKDMKHEPRLAEKWEQKDPLTLRVHLRKGVTFHTGNPFTAADVKWTFERIRKAGDWKALYDAFKDCVIVDDHTVDFVFSRPEPLALNLMTYIFPMDSKFYSGKDAQGKDKDLVSKTDPVFANSNASGTGAFKVTSYEPQVKMVMDRFPAYWDKKSPGNVTQIVLTPIKNAGTRTAALLSGDVDFISPVAPQDQELIKTDKNLNLLNMASTRVITVGINPEVQPEFKDVRVRQAVVSAINNAGIVDKIMNKLTVPAQQLSAKGMAGYNPDLKPRFDLEKAKKLMKEAGFEKGFSVTMIAPNNRYTNDEKAAEAVAAMLARINIKVDLKTMPIAQYWPEFQKRQASLQMVGWHPDTEDTANLFEFLLMCPNKERGFGSYSSGYCNPKLDEMVIAANAEPDTKKRAKMLQDVEKLTYDEAATIPLHYEPLSWAGKKNVKFEKVVNVQNFPDLGDLVIE